METSLPFGLLNQAFCELGGAGVFDEVASATDSTAARGALFYAALRWLRQAGTGPALLVLDDLHWSDADSLSLLSFLCRRLAGMHVAVIAALRSWPAEAAALAAKLVADGSAASHMLAPLSPAAAAAMLTAMLEGTLTADESDQAWMVSAGNRFCSSRSP